MTERRFTFDGVASLYQSARPGYPDALFADVADGIPRGSAALEIGSGSGKATEGFARLGFDITAVEPGGELIRVAKEQLAGFGNVRFVQSTFEDWPLEEEAFRLVFAAQSLHWVPQNVMIAKPAAALAPGGRFAVFGNVPKPLPSPLRDELAAIHDRHGVPEPATLAEAWYLPSGPLAFLFAQSGLFEPVVHKVYPWSRSYTGEAYAALLGTISRYLILDPAVRNALLTDIANEIDAQGGTLERAYETHLFMATKRTG